MNLPPERVIALEPTHEPPKPDWHWLAPFIVFAAFAAPLFI